MGLAEEREAFIAFLVGTRRISVNTRDAYSRDLRQFGEYLRGIGIYDSSGLDTGSVAGYVGFLQAEQRAVSSINRQLATIRAFFAWSGAGMGNPWESRVKFPGRRVEKKLPVILDRGDVDKLLTSSPDPSPAGARDRAMLELLYATGLRATELVNLRLADIGLGAGYVHCSQGKERVVPLGKSACYWVNGYITEARPFLLGNSPDPGTLFLNHRGQSLTRQGFWKIVRKRADACGIGKDITPNMLRHSFAAHMLEGGADLRSLQEMMGHADASTTQVYAQLTGERLADVYARAHPRA